MDLAREYFLLLILLMKLYAILTLSVFMLFSSRKIISKFLYFFPILTSFLSPQAKK